MNLILCLINLKLSDFREIFLFKLSILPSLGFCCPGRPHHRPSIPPATLWSLTAETVSKCSASFSFCVSRISDCSLLSTLDVLRQKVKVKWTRYRPGVAQRVGRGMALLFHDRSARRGWVVSSTPRPHFTPGKDQVSILQEAGWAPGPVWTGGKSRPTGIRSRIVQPAVIRYTDWATRPTDILRQLKYKKEAAPLSVCDCVNRPMSTVAESCDMCLSESITSFSQLQKGSLPAQTDEFLMWRV